MSSPIRRLHRRTFLQQLAAGVAAAPFLSCRSRAQAPSKLVHHATFGAAGMGMSDLKALMKHPSIRIVAACDVDLARTTDFRKMFPDARVYQDFRELLATEKDLQTVNVSTPDHMHAPIGMAALRRGLHLYGQKPLTYSVEEARQLAQFAREKKAVTQMGIQIHSHEHYRTAVRLVQMGAIGKVKEVHSVCAKGWFDAEARPERTDPVPEGLDWNLWLGVAADRPFIGQWYHPSNWRKRLDFGTGTLGDMGCHIFDPVFSALALTAPLSIRSEGPAPGAHSWSPDALHRYTFPGTAYTAGPTIAVTWYDGARRPPAEVLALAVSDDPAADPKTNKMPDTGSIFIGTSGALALPHVGPPRLIGAELKDAAVEKIEAEDHWHQFIDAAMGAGKCSAGFDYAGPLTEAVLLGSIAARFPQQTLEWDAAGLRFKNSPAADRFVRRAYRPGWDSAG